MPTKKTMSNAKILNRTQHKAVVKWIRAYGPRPLTVSYGQLARLAGEQLNIPLNYMQVYTRWQRYGVQGSEAAGLASAAGAPLRQEGASAPATTNAPAAATLIGRISYPPLGDSASDLERRAQRLMDERAQRTPPLSAMSPDEIAQRFRNLGLNVRFFPEDDPRAWEDLEYAAEGQDGAQADSAQADGAEEHDPALYAERKSLSVEVTRRIQLHMEAIGELAELEGTLQDAASWPANAVVRRALKRLSREHA